MNGVREVRTVPYFVVDRIYSHFPIFAGPVANPAVHQSAYNALQNVVIKDIERALGVLSPDSR